MENFIKFLFIFVKINEMYYTVIIEISLGTVSVICRMARMREMAMQRDAGKERRYEMQKNTDRSGSCKI